MPECLDTFQAHACHSNGCSLLVMTVQTVIKGVCTCHGIFGRMRSAGVDYVEYSRSYGGREDGCGDSHPWHPGAAPPREGHGRTEAMLGQRAPSAEPQSLATI